MSLGMEKDGPGGEAVALKSLLADEDLRANGERKALPHSASEKKSLITTEQEQPKRRGRPRKNVAQESANDESQQ
jgi:hypothetical protein